MSNVDELCVKYVFDELDPSEVTLVEQAMLQDQNLLIEVESLKSTWRKLKKMPELEPPENISAAIINQATVHSNQQQLFGSRWKNPGLMATAAVVIFSLLISTAYLLLNEESSQSAVIATDIAETGSQAGALHPIMESFEETLTFWNNRGNMILIGSAGDQEGVRNSDTLENGISTPASRPPEQMVITPSIRDFQLTGIDY